MSITFLNPQFMWLLPVSALPLVIHLFYRKRPGKIEFSDLRFIRAALERIRAGLRLRRYILLFIRTLLLLLLVCFFARPLLRFGAVGAREASPLSVVLLLDTSYSMRYEDGGMSRVERARQVARRILDLLPRQTRIGLIAYSDRVETATPSPGNDRNYLLRLIDTIRPTSRTTNTARALAAAEQLLSGESSNAAVIVLSDMAAHGFRDFNTKFGFRDKRIRVIAFTPSGGQNCWLAGAHADFDESAEHWVVDVKGRASPAGAAAGGSLAYFVEGQKKGNDFPVERGNGLFAGRFSVGSAAEDVSGYVEYAGDRLLEDNRHYFAVRRPGACPAWIIDGDPRFGGASAESFYLKMLFPRTCVLAESDVDKTAFTVPGVVILANVRDDHPRLEQFVKAGGGALIFLGNHSGDGFAPAYLPAEIGSIFTTRQNVFWNEEKREVLSRFPLEGFDGGKIEVDSGFVLRPREGAGVVATLTSGWPFIVEGAYGSGKVMLCASTASRQWNNMPTRPMFAPFIKGLCGYLGAAQPSAEKVMLKVGEPFRRSGSVAEVETPAGRRVKVPASGGEMLFQDTEDPGIYRVISAGREILKFAVNLDTDSGESDLAPVSLAALKRLFAGNPVILLPGQDWEKRFMSVLAGTDITRALILVMLVLFLAEIIFANPAVERNPREVAGKII